MTGDGGHALFDAAMRSGDARLAEQALAEAAPLRSKRIADDLRMLTKTAIPLERDGAFRLRELRRAAQRITRAAA